MKRVKDKELKHGRVLCPLISAIWKDKEQLLF